MSQPRPSLCKLCELEDFADPNLRALIRSAYAHDAAHFGPTFPTGVEYRKCWEVAMSLRAFRDLGVLSEEHELLGVGAGAEATIFWLTNHVRRVFATDLYLADDVDWVAQGAAVSMLSDPGMHATAPWNPRRLVVQHMDAHELLYEGNSFDGLFSSGSIEHFGDYAEVREALAEMERVLKPGGIAALSTEYRIAGERNSLPGTLLFDRSELEAVLLEGRTWQLVEPLDTSLSEATLRNPVDFDEAAADVRAGRRWRTYPHIVLRHELGITWTSVHVALQKPPA